MSNKCSNKRKAREKHGLLVIKMNDFEKISLVADLLYTDTTFLLQRSLNLEQSERASFYAGVIQGLEMIFDFSDDKVVVGFNEKEINAALERARAIQQIVKKDN